MALHKNTQEKLQQIQALLKQKEEIEQKLDTLLAPEKEIVLPFGFSYNNEILQIVKNAGEKGIAVLNILKSLREKYPSYGIDRKKVASGLTYLKNTKKQVAQIGRGVYIATENQKDSS